MRHKQKNGLKKLGGLVLAVLAMGTFTLLYYTLAEETSALPLGSPQETSSPAQKASSVASQPLRDTATAFISVPYISQEGLLPSGCETVSAVMLLQYYGWETNVHDFIDGCLPRSDFWYEDGQLTNVSPNECFIGDPYQTTGLGCYAPVIQNLVSSLSSNLKAEVVKGKSLRSLCEEYVINDQPVLIWCTINLVESAEGTSWRLPNGEDFTWKRNEHCMVLSGWDEENFICMDPYESNGRVVLPADTLQDRYEEMGTQAVVISPQS